MEEQIGEKGQPSTDWLFIYALTKLLGISSSLDATCPFLLPAQSSRYTCTPPHCLKKNGTLALIYTLIPNICDRFWHDWAVPLLLLVV
jgi:hypothetical protein